MTSFDAVDLPRRLSGVLKGNPDEVAAAARATPAAVLVPLYYSDATWNVLFTQRTDHVDVHPGQVSFPGGRIERSDGGAIGAALREAEEEIGLDPSWVDVLGRMDDFLTVTHFTVTPVVGVIPWPFDLRPNPIEVAAAFGVSLRWLADPSNRRSSSQPSPTGEGNVTVHFFEPYEGHVIWGATARITLRLLDLVELVAE